MYIKINGNIVHLYAKSAVFILKNPTKNPVFLSVFYIFISFDYLFSGDDSI